MTEETHQMFNKTMELFNQDKKKMTHFNFDRFLYAFNDVNSVVYRLILEKMPELFVELYLDYNDTPLEQREMKIRFTDDINNPINQDKKKFKIIAENMFQVVFDNKNTILDYNKCEKLKEEITKESQYTSNDIFDL